MTIKFYLADKPRWAELWDSIRERIEKGSRFKGKNKLPRSFEEAARHNAPFEESGDSVKIEKHDDEVAIIYLRRIECRRWTTRIFMKRSLKSVYCEISVSCDDPSVVVIAPRIADILYRKFGGLNKKVVSDSLKASSASAAEIKQIIAEGIEEIKSDNAKSRKKLEDKIKVPRPELTQEMVAKDFGVSRKTVNGWETRQTIDGPDNKSNKFGYYKSLRTNSDLRSAYDQLVQIVQMYKKACENAKKLGRRSITFVTFNEKFHALKVKSLSSLQV